MSLPVPAAERTVLLLELLLKNPEGLTPQEFLTQLDLSRSSLFTLLQTLKTLGYVEQSTVRGRYQAGPRLLSWQRTRVGEASDLLTAFFQETSRYNLEETLVLIVPNSEECFVLSQIESQHNVRTSFEIGQILSFEDSTPGPLFSVKPSKQIIDQGFHLQRTDDRVEIALPICSNAYFPDAAIMLSAPAFRLSRKALLSQAPQLKEIASRISYRLGAQIYAPYLNTDSTPIGPTQPLTFEEIKLFLDGPWAARLACLRPDGSPHVVPIWYEYRKGCFFIAAWKDSLWQNYLNENPNTSLTVDEPWPPLRRVFARAKAVPIDKNELPGGLHGFLNRLSKRYLYQPVDPQLILEKWQPFRLSIDDLRGWRGLHMAS